MKLKIIRFFGLFFALFVIPYKRKISLKELESFTSYGNHIILTKQKWCLTNLLIKGRYKHAAIINSECTHVVEATTHGVRTTNLVTFLQSKHNYMVIRPYNFTLVERLHVDNIMFKYIGRPYDWLFFWETSSFYCSELVATIFNEVRPNLFGVKDRILQPQELLKADVEIVFKKEI